MKGLETFQLLNVVEILEHGQVVLEDKLGIKHTLGFELYEVDDLELGDKIVISNELLNPKSNKFCIPYAFKYVKNCELEDKSILTDDYIIIRKGRKNLLLKRLYG